MKPFRRRLALENTQPQWRPIPAWSWMLTAVIAVALTAFVITTWLLTIASHAKPGTDQANSRLDAVRTGLAAGAGAGAAVGLMLAFRRQHHQEISTALTDHDATERRITELYTKAVEQLGNDKAPVRLGGLYALERLAQDNQAHRQTIVNVICAYLRMPFPVEVPASRTTPETKPITADDTWQQEKQVRLTAQRILSDHLRRPDTNQHITDSSRARFWEQIRLDLTGATLIDFSLTQAIVSEARFGGTTFRGDARFRGTTFNGYAEFDGATFNDSAIFSRAIFNGEAELNEAAGFNSTTFSGAWFDEATFNGYVGFVEATFSDYATFSAATFGGFETAFSKATFGGEVTFDRATFNGFTGFSKATFSDVTRFDEATFYGETRFNGATFNGETRFDEATFNSVTQFSGATFGLGPNAVNFKGSFVHSSKRDHAWPAGWLLHDDGHGRLTVIRANSNPGS